MRNRVGSLLGLAVLALPLAASGAEPQAPPTLTPINARDAAAACPGTARYADALVQGIGRADAHAARPLFAACAAQKRLPGYLWKTDAANLALGAIDLSLGILERDQAALRRAADETADMRSRSLATDEQVRAWTFIPDYVLPNTRTPATVPYVKASASIEVSSRRPFADGLSAENAAYVNVAARTGTAWITTPRVVENITTLGTGNPGDLPHGNAPAAAQSNAQSIPRQTEPITPHAPGT